MHYNKNRPSDWLPGAVQYYPKVPGEHQAPRRIGPASTPKEASLEVKLSSLQHLVLTRLATQRDWCDASDIGASHQAIGHFLTNGLVDRLPPYRHLPPRYRINSAGIAALDRAGCAGASEP